MIKLTPRPTFLATLKLTVPGAAEPATIAFTFRHKGRTALRAWLDRPAAAKARGEVLTDAAFLGEVIEGWSGPVNEDGSQCPFTEDALRQLLDAYPASAGEIYDGYLEAQAESRIKNSAR